MSDKDLQRQLFDSAVENETRRRLGNGLTRGQIEDIVERAYEKLGAIGEPDNKSVWNFEMELLFSGLRQTCPHLTVEDTPAITPHSGQPLSARRKLELANEAIAAARATDDAA